MPHNILRVNYYKKWLKEVNTNLLTLYIITIFIFVDNVKHLIYSQIVLLIFLLFIIYNISSLIK